MICPRARAQGTRERVRTSHRDENTRTWLQGSAAGQGASGLSADHAPRAPMHRRGMLTRHAQARRGRSSHTLPGQQRSCDAPAPALLVPAPDPAARLPVSTVESRAPVKGGWQVGCETDKFCSLGDRTLFPNKVSLSPSLPLSLSFSLSLSLSLLLARQGRRTRSSS